jgi:LmbE family N-acetylglucosaminyl deacetylase
MNVQHVWIRLPDGNYAGNGFPSMNNTSLAQLYSGQIRAIQTLPLVAQTLHLDLSDAPLSVYTLDALKQSLVDIVRASKPKVVRTQDWTGDKRQDHSDHIIVAKLMKDIMKEFPETELVG